MTAPPEGGHPPEPPDEESRPEGRPSPERNPTGSPEWSRSNPSAPPPNDPDTETALLGAILTSGRRVLDACAEAGLTSADFYHPRHQAIYDAAARVASGGADPDLPLVAAQLAGRIPATDLVEILADGGFTGNAHAYAERLIALRRRRTTLAAAIDLADAARTGTSLNRALDRLITTHDTGTATTGNLIDVDLDAVLRGDVTTETPLYLTRSDGNALLYPGRIHDIHAEPGVGKTWLGLTAVLEVLNAGGSAIYIDFEDQATGIVSRLLTLGANPNDLARDAERFRYLDPAGPLDPTDLLDLDRIVAQLCADLVVIDGVAIAIARQGLKEKDNDEVNTWADMLPRRVARAGAAVLMLDHVQKHREGRARGARGAGAKLGIIDGASYSARTIRNYSRTNAGAIKLVIAKDRQGAIGPIDTTAAIVTMTPTDNRLDVDIKTTADGPWRPTAIMEKITRHLKTYEGAQTAKALVDALGSKPKHIDQALEELVEDGYLGKTTKPGHPTSYTFKAVFHDPERQASDDADPEQLPDEPEGMF